MKKVFVTGMGVISAIGNNVDENHLSLKEGRTGISFNAKYFSSKYTSLYPFGEVKQSDSELKSSLSVDDYKGLTRTDLLAFKAFEEATQMAGLGDRELSNTQTGLISGSTVGGMVMTNQVYEDGNNRAKSTEFLASYDYCSHTMRLIDAYRIKGITDTINTACSSSANAIMLGARLIKSGRAKRMIVGGVDSLAKFTVNGFNSLQILSDELCRPFDAKRKGLNLGEGAAYLVLESEDVVGDKKILAEVAGYGNSNDAYHPSSLSPDAVGVIAAMQGAMDSAGVNPDEVDSINAHGTSTENNDQTELFGINKLFNEIPPFCSTKSFTGHTLGAAGAIEAVYSIVSLNEGELYPSLQFDTPIADLQHNPTLIYRSGQEVKVVLSNSFGFGGNCTSLVFKK
ncbi:MAG: beta-ketoacyl-[acyl-carrier-protein] synthase family protein [Reichenbachiella sp.]